MSKKIEKLIDMINNGWSLFEEWTYSGRSFLVKRKNDGIQMMVVLRNGSTRKPTKREIEEVGICSNKYRS